MTDSAIPGSLTFLLSEKIIIFRHKVYIFYMIKNCRSVIDTRVTLLQAITYTNYE